MEAQKLRMEAELQQQRMHLEAAAQRSALMALRCEEEEAMRMVCNGHCPDRRHFLVQQGSPRVKAQLEEFGFVVIELDTSEFLLSGGSVFCMKQHYWS